MVSYRKNVRLLVLGESGSCGIYAGISDLSLLYPDHPKFFLNQGRRFLLLKTTSGFLQRNIIIPL